MSAAPRPGKNGGRSNFSMLPFDARYKIISLLQDGATAQAVCAAPEVVEAYARIGEKPSRAALSRVRQCREYRELTERRTKMKQSIYADRITSEILKENATAESIGEQVRVSLLNLVRDCASINPDDPKEVERLARSAVNLTNDRKDRVINDLRRKLDAVQAECDKRIASFETALAERDARIAELVNAGKPAAAGLSPEALRKAEEKIKLI